MMGLELSVLREVLTRGWAGAGGMGSGGTWGKGRPWRRARCDGGCCWDDMAEDLVTEMGY